MGFKAGGEASSLALLAGRWGEAKSPLSAPDVSAAGCPPAYNEAAQQFISLREQPSTAQSETRHMQIQVRASDGANRNME